MKNLILMAFLIFSASVALAQIEVVKPGATESVRLDKDKPTVYADYLCENATDIYLTLHNNTIWMIGIWTYKSYPLTKKAIPRNGTLHFVIPNNEEVQMYYYVERDEITGKKLKVKQPSHPLQGGGGDIVSGDAVIFPVKKEHLKKGLNIYFSMNYDWERPGGNIFHLSEPQHKVYFRSELLNPSYTIFTPADSTAPKYERYKPKTCSQKEPHLKK